VGKSSSASLLLVADGTSPHSVSWAHGAAEIFPRVTLLSSRSSQRPNSLPENVEWISGGGLRSARSHLGRLARGAGSDTQAVKGAKPSRLVTIRHGIELATALTLNTAIRRTLEHASFSLVHALRLPWEGIASAGLRQPLAPTVLSLWGSDLYSQANSSPTLGRLSKRTLDRVVGLTADCTRDIRLAHEWGLPETAVTAVIAGNMGIKKLDPDYAIESHPGELTFTCVRGPRDSVRWENMLQSFALYIAQEGNHDCKLVLANFDSEDVHRRVREFGIQQHTEIAKHLSIQAYRDLVTRTDVILSPTVSDGVPISLLEFMQGGASPVVGDLESLSEFLTDGEDAALVNADDVGSILAGMNMVSSVEFQSRATDPNSIVERRYGREESITRTQDFYDRVLFATERG